MKISQEFIHQLLGKIDIVTVVEEYLTLKRAGREFSACCPFHEERTASFTVSPQKQFFHCFGCQAHGNAIDFIMRLEHTTFLETIERLAGLAGLSLPEKTSSPSSSSPLASKSSSELQALRTQSEDEQTILQKIIEFYHEQLFSPAARSVLEELMQKRKLSEALLRREKIGFVIAGALLKRHPSLDKKLLQRWGLLGELTSDFSSSADRRETFARRILFPIKDEKGKIAGFGARALGEVKPKYLNSKETLYFRKREILYRWFDALSERKQALKVGLPDAVLLVEGYFDALSLADRGYEPVIAGLGTSIGEWQLKKIFQRFDSLYVAYDGDAAGESAKFKLLERALPYLRPGKRLYFVMLPAGEDPDSLLRRSSEGALQFESALKEALPLSKYLFQKLTAEIDLSSEEGKAALVRRANALIEKLPDPDFQDQLRTRLNQTIGVFVPHQGAPFLLSKKAAGLARRRGRGSDPIFEPAALRRLVALLLQNPQLALSVEADLSALKTLAAESEKVQLFLTLFRQAKRQSNFSLAQRVEVWRNTSYYALLSQLSVWNHLVDPQHEAAVFKSSLAQLLEQTLEREIDKLLLKSKNFGLSLSEQQLYLKLLKHLKK